MAAEDWIPWGIDEDEYFQQLEPVYHPAHIRPYTDKFTFNQRRLRTQKQLDIIKENHFMSEFTKTGLMKTGRRTGVSYDIESLIGAEVVVQVEKEKFPVITKELVEANKFYISSPNVFNNGWGHPTLDETIKHAQDMLQKRKDINEVAIVEIVRVVRRKPIEVDIETV